MIHLSPASRSHLLSLRLVSRLLLLAGIRPVQFLSCCCYTSTLPHKPISSSLTWPPRSKHTLAPPAAHLPALAHVHKTGKVHSARVWARLAEQGGGDVGEGEEEGGSEGGGGPAVGDGAARWGGAIGLSLQTRNETDPSQHWVIDISPHEFYTSALKITQKIAQENTTLIPKLENDKKMDAAAAGGGNDTASANPGTNSRLHFSAYKTGLCPHQWACSGLGLDLGVDQSPSPLISLASPFARLAEKWAFPDVMLDCHRQGQPR
ncbi:hypothetical protein B0H14DRAFT_2576454 [Mycena olivaceomarginata]|nr:hypothetical protein B0H14DRAFT_2576454 [Mycena olivaceomarginata]